MADIFKKFTKETNKALSDVTKEISREENKNAFDKVSRTIIRTRKKANSKKKRHWTDWL